MALSQKRPRVPAPRLIEPFKNSKTHSPQGWIPVVLLWWEHAAYVRRAASAT